MNDTTPPPLPLEDRIRSWIVPRRFYLWHKHRRALRRSDPELGLIPYLASPERVSLDVGASKGLYTYALFPHSLAVHSFEPNPSVYPLLCSRVDGLAGNVTTHQIALSNVTGTSELLVPQRGTSKFDHPSGSLSEIAIDRPHTRTAVRTSRLDDLGITNVGFMKIDVEGFERAVLEGARETIRRDKPNLLIELEERHTKVPLTEMVGFVCSLGYECVILLRGVLTPFSAFDVAQNERGVTKHYVNNFMFLPVGK